MRAAGERFEPSNLLAPPVIQGNRPGCARSGESAGWPGSVATVAVLSSRVERGFERAAADVRTATEACPIDQHRAADSSDELNEVAMACRGDQQAFERLYRRHVGRVHGLAWRLATGHEVDDVTQDVFVRAWEKLGTFRGDSSFGTWLHRLAVNVIMERHRRAQRRAAERVDGGEAALERAAALEHDANLPIDLEAALEHLPLGARQVFVLHDVEGYRHHEIGRAMGIAIGTSKGQLHRARMMLRRMLGAGANAERQGGRARAGASEP